MKAVVALCLLLLAVGLSEAARLRREEKYTTKYDNIDLEDILNNKRLLNNYVNCLLEKGKCTADGKELKDHVPDALVTDCSKCSDKQKDGIKQVLKHLINKEPEIYKELEAKYDPEGIFRKKHEKEFKELKESP